MDGLLDIGFHLLFGIDSPLGGCPHQSGTLLPFCAGPEAGKEWNLKVETCGNIIPHFIDIRLIAVRDTLGEACGNDWQPLFHGKGAMQFCGRFTSPGKVAAQGDAPVPVRQVRSRPEFFGGHSK